MKPYVVLLCLMLVSSLAGGQELQQTRVAGPASNILDSPFSVGQILEGGVVLEVAPDLFQKLLDGPDVLNLKQMPLTSSRSLDLLLRRLPGSTHEVRVVDEQGERTIKVSGAFYSGHVAGHLGSYVFMAAFPGMVNGYFYFAEQSQLFYLSSGIPNGTLAPTIMNARDTLVLDDEDHWACEVLDLSSRRGRLDPDATAMPIATLPFPQDAAAPATSGFDRALTVQVTELFLECDHQFRELYNSAEDAAAYAITLFTAISDVYRRDLGTILTMPPGYVRVWETVPPWGVADEYLDILALRAWWTSDFNPLKDIKRGSVHLLTHSWGGGVALALDSICDNDAGYEVSSVVGWFPQPLQYSHPGNNDPFTVAHEEGHSFGSIHTFDYTPPIECEDGSGPDKGTIMSYCHLNPGGVSNIGMRFHSRVQRELREVMSTYTCSPTMTLQKGDFDYDGDVDEADVTAALTCIQQGFDSLGCEETFNMDNEGGISYCDYYRVVLMADPGAWIPDCNGDGEPDFCEAVDPCFLDATVTPLSTSVVRGETLAMDVLIHNPLAVDVTADYWLEAFGLDGNAMDVNPLAFTTISLGPGEQELRRVALPIEADAPAGSPYTVELKVVSLYPHFTEEDLFQFEVTAE